MNAQIQRFSRSSNRCFPLYLSLVALLLLLGTSSRAPAQPAKLITDGFAHNDYEHTRPLLDALALGFCAVEADVFLTNGLMLVGHDPRDLTPTRALTNLYLDPLAEWVRRNKGCVHPGGPEFLLLIDIKTEAEPTYEALRRILQPYRSILTTFSGANIQTNAIRVILSGERPIQMVSNEVERVVAIDGRTADLAANPAASLIPLVSDNWTKLFRWNGEGTIPPAEKERLRSLVTQAHEQKRLFRLWAAPDLPSAWTLQRELGVDLVNTDRLQDFARTSKAGH